MTDNRRWLALPAGVRRRMTEEADLVMQELRMLREEAPYLMEDPDAPGWALERCAANMDELLERADRLSREQLVLAGE